MREISDDADEILTRGPIELIPGRYQAAIEGRVVDLWPSEVAILRLLMHHETSVINQKHLAHVVMGANEPTLTDYMAVCKRVSRLRRKLGVGGKWIRTVRGAGYCFCPPDYRPHGFLSVAMALLSGWWVAGRSWASGHRLTLWGTGSLAGVSLFFAGATYVWGATESEPAWSPVSLAQAGPVRSLAIGKPVNVPGPALSGWGQIGHGLCGAEMGGVFASISTPWNRLSDEAAKLRQFSVTVERRGIKFDPLDKPALTRQLRKVPASEWEIGRADAMAFSQDGRVHVVSEDGDRIVVFDREGVARNSYEIGDGTDLPGGTAAAILCEGVCMVFGAEPDTQSDAVTIRTRDLASGREGTLSYPLSQGSVRVIGATGLKNGWVLVLEGSEFDASLYITHVDRLRESRVSQVKTLVLQMPLDIPEAGSPSVAMRYEAVASSEMTSDQFLVIVSALNERGHGKLVPLVLEADGKLMAER